MLLQVSTAPAWAEGPGRPQSAAPGTWKPNPSELADFMRAVTARYSGGFDPDGAGPAPLLPAVQALQVWNEPNIITSLTPQYEGQTAFSPGPLPGDAQRRLLGGQVGEPAMLVVTAGTSPYGDPPGGNRVRPVDFWRAGAVCARGEEEEAKKKKGASKRVFVRTQELPRPGEVRRSRPSPDQHQRGAAAFGHQPGRRLQPGPGSDRARAARRRGRWNGVAGSASGLGDEFWWRSNPPDPAGAPLAARRAGSSRRCIWHGRMARVS